MTLKTWFGLSIAALTASIVPTIALAQQATTSQQALSAEISGEIISLGDDDFLLETESGQILVDAEERPLRRANLSTGETVTVTGRFDDDNFDAYTITRSNGEMISVWD
jgi:uncharacterized protein YdeI (BOF family)